ncbi:MAG: winged helix-turn-helix transcriptional regulator [Desulfovibrio sp.]|nr:winged helix-turn-helix transcriptional regulator [Desulfovibrio sp.]
MRERHKRSIAEQAKIFKALGHPSRLLMVDALRDGEKCVCELRELVGDDMSTISRHLAVLREAGVVTSEKRGTSIYYRLRLGCLDQFLHYTATAVQQKAREQLKAVQTR